MKFHRCLAAALMVASLAWLHAGCKSSTPTQTCDAPKTGTPPNCKCPAGTLDPDCRVDCTTTNVVTDSGGIDATTVVFNDFSVPDGGRLDVTLDWTNAASPIGFYLVPANTCTTAADFNARNCSFLIRYEPSSAKPIKISKSSFSAGNYRWLIANYAKEQESVSLGIVLNKGTGCPALPGATVAAAAAEQRAQPPIEHLERR